MSYTPEQIKRLEDIKALNKANLEPHIEIAKQANLFEIMTNDGYSLKPSGLTQYETIEGGHRVGNLFVDPISRNWVYVAIGQGAENAIAYAMREYGLNFPEAVRHLDPTTPELITIKNYSAEKPRPVVVPAKREPAAVVEREKVIISFNQPTTAEHEKLGRAYCTRRGISAETVNFALTHKVIGFGVSNFSGGKMPGVRFLGYDENGDLRSAETRHLTDKRSTLAEKGSTRLYCPILPGNPKVVHIVEGGFDGLALMDLFHRNCIGMDCPTIIIAGGCGRTWVDNPVIKPILLAADKIIIWAENETGKTYELKNIKQLDTDAKHLAQRQKIIEIGVDGKKVLINKPKGGFKDLADKNLSEVVGLKIQNMRAKDNALSIELSSVVQSKFQNRERMVHLCH